MNRVHIARHRVTDSVVAWAHSEESLQEALNACRLKADDFDFEVLSGATANDFVKRRGSK